MGAFVAEDRHEFGVGERRERALAEHHAAAHTGKAVGQRLGDVKHPQPVHPVPAVADQVDDHPVMRPTAPGGDGHLHHGAEQPRADQ